MRITLHIGPEEASAARIGAVLADQRARLLQRGILYARTPGTRSHTQLFMAATDPGHIDPLRHEGGLALPQDQAVLRRDLMAGLTREVAEHAPHTLILCCAQLGAGLRSPSEVARLREMLGALSDDIRVIAHVDAPAAMLARAYGAQILEGRALSLEAELALAGTHWWKSALAACPRIDPAAGVFAQTQGPCHWLDLPALVAFWEGAFGTGRVHLHSYDAARFASPRVAQDITAAFGIEAEVQAAGVALPAPPSAATLARGRQLNALILRLLAQRRHILPRRIWRGLIQQVAVDGPPLDLASLHRISDHFAPALARLCDQHPGLDAHRLAVPPAAGRTDWAEADPLFGFRPSQYLLGFMWRIDKATREARQQNDAAQLPRAEDPPQTAPATGAGAAASLPPLAVKNLRALRGSRFAPHNTLGTVDDGVPGTPYPARAPRPLPEGSTGTVIVGCMKNEAPYILEWIAYHRAIGIDNFVIYTNGCEDGTTQILDRLQQMGHLQHRNNDDWRGNSPQQHALKSALGEDVIKRADWIIHIDVDEFINIRCGNGTVEDLLAQVPDATNIAMTWRLFGHNDVTALNADFVTEQFDRCAPKFCPKPHTVWGFKTMFRNIGAYGKISCHRPNKLSEEARARVKWVNGSGQDMTRDAIRNGWRSSRKNIGYDLVQLNHYALRSAESFLIKRQRGRALHVDRAIGINYWIRMDWNDVRDVTIKRNLPRLRAEYDRLLADDTLRHWHESGLAWHRAKAAELHQTPEFADLYRDALALRLRGAERVAYALALDMES